MRLGIYIGSFNPPHLGHKKVIDYLLENKYVDKVLIVPTPNYWTKNNLVDIKDRINMLKFYENDIVKVDTIHNNYEYTYQVLESINQDYDKDELYLIIGSDNLESLHKWKNIQEVLKYKIIVLKRKNIIKNKELDDKNFIYINNYPFLDVSSTEVRKGNYNYLDKNIKKYIIDNNLYTNKKETNL